MSGRLLIPGEPAATGLTESERDGLLGAFELAYVAGEYETALGLLNALFQGEPALELEYGVYAWRCDEASRRALADPSADEVIRRTNWSHASLWRRVSLWIRGRRPRWRMVRCKWCGRYTDVRTPDGASEGGCHRCGRPYAKPHLYWDSMEGFAYCAGRGSWEGSQQEIEREWNAFYDALQKKFPEHLL
jgi:hypothetical protein